VGVEDINLAVREARLEDALDLAKASVRTEPSAIQPRVVLFELLCVSGDWDRAEAQLATLSKLGKPDMGTRYGTLLHAEKARERVLCGQQDVTTPTPAPDWLFRWQEAVAASSQKDWSKLRQVHAEFQEQPSLAGKVNGHAFTAFADSDARFAPIFEIAVEDKYLWLPMADTQSVMFPSEADTLLDFLWRPAMFMPRAGGQAILGSLMGRLPGSTDPALPGKIRLGRQIHWLEGVDVDIACGQRIFVTDADSHPVSALKHINFEPDGAPS
jgi:type VI secretion system protein ImpE